MSSQFVVGIDLGTTNSAVAYVDTQDPSARIQLFQIPQLIAASTTEARSTLPSFLYLPSETEFSALALSLPWNQTQRSFAGTFARDHGWKVPMRLVSSAKSWLCHSGVDRSAPILPWQAPDEVQKISPEQASARYLEHIRNAWDFAFDKFGAKLADQEVFLTVPASFDAVARELTVRAAQLAGLMHVTLLEEPQAAFYAWLGRSAEGWRRDLSVGDVVLVCDVGGGTTDFSLIAVSEAEGNLQLERVAVGDHILLGGDNMDLALAHNIRVRVESQGSKLDNWQFAALVHSCRQAKEDLLEKNLEVAPVVILGRGSKVIGGSIKTELKKSELEAILVDGFFPICDRAARPAKAARVGFRELGLPFASDAGITRHLAQFVGAHRQPTAVLFNGGVMKGEPLRKRVTDTLSSWNGQPLKLLSGTDFDLAVAQGAAYYGLVRRGRGVRIRGGTARAYYVGIESSMPAIPGMTPPLKALCVAPFGMEEGSESEVADREFGLVVGESAEFRFLASSQRKDDRVGNLVEEVDDRMTELAPVATTLGENGESGAGNVVPVKLHSRVTELGTLELWCEEVGGAARRWKLEYNVREAS